jgi:hypothetical protein
LTSKNKRKREGFRVRGFRGLGFRGSGVQGVRGLGLRDSRFRVLVWKSRVRG